MAVVLHEVEDWGELAGRWSGIVTEHVQVEGTRVRLLRAPHRGDGGDGHRVAFVCVHGLGGAATNWLEVMPGLAELGDVVALDLAGHGETVPPRETSARVEANARLVRAVVRRLGLEPVVLLGNSMGGMIATLVAADDPDLVRALVLIDPALPAPVSAALRVPAAALVTFGPFLVPRLARTLIDRRWDRSTAEQLYERTEGIVFADPSRTDEALRVVGVANAARGQDLQWRRAALVAATSSLMRLLTGTGRARMLEAVESVTAPTLLLWGDQDQLVGRPVIEGTSERRPDWDVEILEDVGHVPQLETPGTTLDLVTRWLAGLDAELAPAGG